MLHYFFSKQNELGEFLQHSRHHKTLENEMNRQACSLPSRSSHFSTNTRVLHTKHVMQINLLRSDVMLTIFETTGEHRTTESMAL
jgi:hypothetical protein